MKPLVSVIMAARNEEQHIGLAIASVLEQTLSDLELIVIDDASNDGTAQIIQSFAKIDSRITILSNSDRLGRARTRNRGIQEAHADLIAILDADDLMMPERLERQIEFMRANPEIGMLGSGAYYFLSGAYEIRCVQSPLEDTIIRRMLIRGIMPFIHPSMMFRREQILSVGGYFCITPNYNEDLSLCARLIHQTRGASLSDKLIIFSADGLLNACKLKGKYQEGVGQTCYFLKQGFNFDLCATMIKHWILGNLMPESVLSALMRWRLRQLPICSLQESEKVTSWIGFLNQKYLTRVR